MNMNLGVEPSNLILRTKQPQQMQGQNYKLVI
jgi:hypothetical protein